MSVVAVEPLTEQAMELLRQLEQLNVIRLLPGAVTVVPPPRIDLGSLYGSISKEEGEQWQREIEEMRNEWDRDF